MVTIRYFSVIILSLFFLAGCAGMANRETPEAFATRFYTNIAENNTEELVNMFDMSGLSKDDMPLVKNKLAFVLTQLSREFESKGGLERIEISNLDMPEDRQTADLDIIVYFHDGSTRDDHMHLVKTASGWKIY